MNLSAYNQVQLSNAAEKYFLKLTNAVRYRVEQILKSFEQAVIKENNRLAKTQDEIVLKSKRN